MEDSEQGSFKVAINDKMGNFFHYLRDSAPYIGIFGLLAGLFVGWLRQSLLPVLQVKIESTWEPGNLLHIRLKAENTSKVPARVEYARLQRLEHTRTLPVLETLGDSVAFEKDDWDKMAPEQQPDWMQPITIARPKSGDWIKPREVIGVEVLYHPSAAAFAVHCGFRVKVKSAISTRVHRHELRFTTTAWALRPGARQRSSQITKDERVV